jgi:hypothetical protein
MMAGLYCESKENHGYSVLRTPACAVAEEVKRPHDSSSPSSNTALNHGNSSPPSERSHSRIRSQLPLCTSPWHLYQGQILQSLLASPILWRLNLILFYWMLIIRTSPCLDNGVPWSYQSSAEELQGCWDGSDGRLYCGRIAINASCVYSL